MRERANERAQEAREGFRVSGDRDWRIPSMLDGWVAAAAAAAAAAGSGAERGRTQRRAAGIQTAGQLSIACPRSPITTRPLSAWICGDIRGRQPYITSVHLYRRARTHAHHSPGARGRGGVRLIRAGTRRNCRASRPRDAPPFWRRTPAAALPPITPAPACGIAKRRSSIYVSRPVALCSVATAARSFLGRGTPVLGMHQEPPDKSPPPPPSASKRTHPAAASNACSVARPHFPASDSK